MAVRKKKNPRILIVTPEITYLPAGMGNMANRMTAEQLLLAMRPHPTFEEALAEALQDLTAKLNA